MERKTFKDDYDHISESIEYVLENVLQDDDGSEEFKEMTNSFNSNMENSCECADCRQSCWHGVNYVLRDKKLILNEDRRCKDLIYECSDSCRCQQCNNKLVQYGPTDDLIIKHFDGKGHGLVSAKLIVEGSFICEYAGEILTKTEASRRDQENQRLNYMNYIFCLNEINSSDKSQRIQTFIDPSFKGNIGRYINHSCDANCDIISVRVDCIIPKIAIFANRDIPIGTEITFNYGPSGGVNDEQKRKCFCLSKNCKIYLPNLSFQ